MNNILLCSFTICENDSLSFTFTSEEFSALWDDTHLCGRLPARVEELFSLKSLEAIRNIEAAPAALRLELCAGAEVRPVCAFVAAGQSGALVFSLVGMPAGEHRVDAGAAETLPALCLTYKAGCRRVTGANAAARRELGIPAGGEWINLSGRIHTDDAARLEQAELLARVAGVASLTEVRVYSEAGSVRWLQCSISAGRPGEYTMTAHMVDILKEAEHTLAEAHSALLTITQNVDCAIFTASLEDGHVTLVYANDAFYDMLGYTPDKLGPGSEQLDKIIFHENDRAKLLNGIALGAGAFEGRIVRQSGESFWCTLRSHAIAAPAGGEYYVCAFQDISHIKAVEHELRLSNSRYQLLLGNSGGMFYEADLESDTLSRSLGGRDDILPWRSIGGLPGSLCDHGIVPEEHREALREAYNRIKSGAEKQTLTMRCRRIDGGQIWAEVSMFCIYDQSKKPIRALIILKDVTRQRELEIGYKIEEQYREAMIGSSVAIIKFSLATEGIISHIQDGKELAVPGDAAYNLSDLFQSSQSNVHPGDRQAVSDFYSSRRITVEHARRGVHGDFCDFRMKTGKKDPYIWVRGTLNVLTSPENGELICFSYITDINSQKEKEIELTKKAETDTLTGVLNRAAIKARVDSFLGQSSARGGIHALIMLDLDGFKQVNDQYGHEAGDAVLRELGSRLRRTSRTSDHVARLGGDEFMIFLKDAKGLDDIARKANKICALCSSLHINSARANFLSASMGIAVAPGDGLCFDELYRSADKAMYASKAMGKNCVSFFSDCMAYGCDAEER